MSNHTSSCDSKISVEVYQRQNQQQISLASSINFKKFHRSKVESVKMPLIFYHAVAALCLTIAGVTSLSIKSPVKSEDLLSSPCPDLFRYDNALIQKDQWTASLVISPHHDLHGVWIRLIFDNPIKELTLGDDYAEVVPSDERNEFLIKNNRMLLRSGEEKVLKISAKYDDDKVPSLMEYRLNAVTVCSNANTNLTDYFLGDRSMQGFLQTLLSKQPILNKKDPDYECGLPSKNTDKSSDPWQASIFITHGGKKDYICQSNLISPKYLITAAHCVTFLQSTIKIPIGKLSVNIEQEEIPVAKVILYPGYEPNTLLNDVALIELVRPVTISDKVRPICLEDKVDLVEKEGVIVDNTLEKEKSALSSKVKEIRGEECSKRLPQLQSLLGDNTYCAYYLADKPCIGESGSGLISLKEGTDKIWELRGVVILSPDLQDKSGCGQENTVLLADISKYIKWIRASII